MSDLFRVEDWELNWSNSGRSQSQSLAECVTLCFAGGGRLAVLGSGAMLSDQYIDKEDNNKIKDVLFEYLTSGGTIGDEEKVKINEIDADDPEVSDYNMVPETSLMAERLRVCLQESDEVPSDFTRLFKTRLYSISSGLVPAAIKSYTDLNVKHEPLKLITPQFETPLPPLQAAVFPPSFRYNFGFSLQFAVIHFRPCSGSYPIPSWSCLTWTKPFPVRNQDWPRSPTSAPMQVVKKVFPLKSHFEASNEIAFFPDLDYFVREAADIMGITQNLPVQAQDPKHILEYVLAHIVEFKKLNQDTRPTHFDGIV